MASAHYFAFPTTCWWNGLFFPVGWFEVEAPFHSLLFFPKQGKSEIWGII
jgi:hypothetical protein